MVWILAQEIWPLSAKLLTSIRPKSYMEGLGKMLIVQSLILFARWYTKILLMTVGDKTCLKFTQDFTQVFEMQNLKVLQDSFKKSEILQ
jgi:hypothetical protein